MYNQNVNKGYLKSTTTSILKNISLPESDKPILNFLTDKKFDKFAVFAWLTTSLILEALLEESADNSNRFIDSEAAYIVETLVACSNDCLNDFLSNKGRECLKKIKIHEKCAKKLTEAEKRVKEEGKGVDSELKKLSFTLIGVEKKKPFSKKDFNEVVERILEYSASQSIFDEICFNWLKGKAEKLRNNNTNLCCKTIFFKDELLVAQEGASQEFKKYSWPIANKNIIHHLSKTIVGFLNNKKGGIIYIGICEDRTRKIVVVGIPLTLIQLKELFEFMKKQIVQNIFPKHPQFIIKKQTHEINPLNGRFVINDYVSLDYQCVVNAEQKDQVHYTNSQDEKHGNQLYLVRVCVKPGHPKHLYHLINEQNGLDFFIRDDRNVEKKPFPEAHKMVLERLERFQKAGENEQEKESLKPKPFHDNCRFKVETIVNYNEEDEGEGEEEM